MIDTNNDKFVIYTVAGTTSSSSTKLPVTIGGIVGSCVIVITGIIMTVFVLRYIYTYMFINY